MTNHLLLLPADVLEFKIKGFLDLREQAQLAVNNYFLIGWRRNNGVNAPLGSALKMWANIPRALCYLLNGHLAGFINQTGVTSGPIVDLIRYRPKAIVDLDHLERFPSWVIRLAKATISPSSKPRWIGFLVTNMTLTDIIPYNRILHTMIEHKHMVGIIASSLLQINPDLYIKIIRAYIADCPYINYRETWTPIKLDALIEYLKKEGLPSDLEALLPPRIYNHAMSKLATG